MAQHTPEIPVLIINELRAGMADTMARSGQPDTPMLALMGPCSPDPNRMPDGRLSVVSHLQTVAEAAQGLGNIKPVGRHVSAKPRTNMGYTGLVHEPNGPEMYREAAHQLTLSGVALASEVMGEVDYSVAGPYLTVGWIGARNVDDTGPRYLFRPTSEDIERGLHPLPVFVKNGADGSLDGTINALRTIMSEKPRTRTLITPGGYKTVTTHANPHVGVILRGSKVRPSGPIDEILTREVTEARTRLNAEFDQRIPIIVDASHAHANGEGGGEKGQLIVTSSLGELMLTGLEVDGVMAETYIQSGKQPEYGPIPGLSWTDKCIGQENAVKLLGSMSRTWSERARNLIPV